MASPVVLILGAGSNIGAHVAKAFAAKGYKVALVSRKAQDRASEDGHLQIQADLTNPRSVDGVFTRVRESLGAPSVVVYNAAAAISNPADDPFALSVSDLEKTLAINTTSVLAAAHEATLSFASLPSSASRTFIYTGNRLNIAPIAPMLSLGVGKSATAHMMRSASEAYKSKGYKFYYADERKTDGSPVYSAIDGPAHGAFYTELAEHGSQGPWLATFVKGEGYKEF